MPLAAPKPCAAPGCRALVRGGRYCPAHQDKAREAEQARNRRAREGDPFLWSGKWRGIRAAYLKRHPTCAECGQPATQVHHVIPRALAPALALDWRNLAAYCVACHAVAHHRAGSGWAANPGGKGRL